MPRGVPKSGFRMTRKRLSENFSAPALYTSNRQAVAAMTPPKVETVEEIQKKLSDRFEALEIMSRATGNGINRSLIVSGPAGLGKSYTVESVMSELEAKGRSVTYIKGYVRPLALYRLLYNSRHAKSVLVFDDSDSIFHDDVSMNLLKGACDSTDRRVLYWLSESVTRLEDEEGDSIPEKFEFEGSIVFITNYDFERLIDSGNKLAPHFQALVSRSHYLDLEMKTKMDYVVRIRQVVGAGMLLSRGLNKSEEILILEFIENNMERLRELSLRMVVKLATLFKMDQKNWQKLARQTCFRAN
jgi:hypothetical protein